MTDFEKQFRDMHAAKTKQLREMWSNGHKLRLARTAAKEAEEANKAEEAKAAKKAQAAKEAEAKAKAREERRTCLSGYVSQPNWQGAN